MDVAIVGESNTVLTFGVAVVVVVAVLLCRKDLELFETTKINSSKGFNL